MSEMPPGSGACCLPTVEGITYLKIGPRGAMVGMRGLDAVFEQLYALGRRPDEATDAELVGMARKFNYIPHRAAVESDYALALREGYARFWANRGQ